MKYTRAQITKAIDYWTQQLNVLDESKSKLIDALISKFGENVVQSNEKTYILTKDDMYAIYEILNLHLFNGQLGEVDLQFWPEWRIVGKLDEHALASGVMDSDVKNASCYGVHSAICKDVIDEKGNIVDVKISDDIIMMNSTYLTKCVFIFAVACICHEMIHFYDRHFDEYHDLALLQSQTNVAQNFHSTKNFIQKKKEAIENGINVIEKPSEIDTFQSLNSKARVTLGKVLDEADNESHISFNGTTLVMRGKGSNKFMIAQID